jgi:hypothetical protein
MIRFGGRACTAAAVHGRVVCWGGVVAIGINAAALLAGGYAPAGAESDSSTPCSVRIARRLLRVRLSPQASWGTAELASIADAGQAWRPSTVSRVIVGALGTMPPGEHSAPHIH